MPEISPLTALSPLDGRYAVQTAPLRAFFSEYGFIKRRVEVEVLWLQALAEESGIADLDVVKYFGFEPFFQSVPIECGPFPHFELKTIEENDRYVTKTDYRGLTARWHIASGT